MVKSEHGEHQGARLWKRYVSHVGLHRAVLPLLQEAVRERGREEGEGERNRDREKERER